VQRHDMLGMFPQQFTRVQLRKQLFYCAQEHDTSTAY
jgi:hypothetical protein